MNATGLVKRVVLKSKRNLEMKFAGVYESGDLPLFDDGITDVKLDDRPVEECILNHTNLFDKGVTNPDDRPFIRAVVKLHRSRSKGDVKAMRVDVTLNIRAADQDKAVALLAFIGSETDREGAVLDLELGEVT